MDHFFRFFDFPNEPGLWQEVAGITEALQSGSASISSQFHRDLFSHLPLGRMRTSKCQFLKVSNTYIFNPQMSNISCYLPWQKGLMIHQSIVV